MTATDPPVCERAEQLRDLDGHRVRLRGTYTAVPTLKKMPRPGRAPETVDLGEVVIALADAEETLVALGADPRPREEIAEFDGRRVEVVGRLTLEPESEGRGAARRPSPVLEDPTGLRLA